jgi:hypothetical protein
LKILIGIAIDEKNYSHDVAQATMTGKSRIGNE